MSTFMFSAQDVCATRLCAAQGCPDEASGSGIALCARHDKEHRAGHTIPLHVTPPPGEPVLWCSQCRTDKPDREFSPRPEGAKNSPHRRNRYWNCRACEARRKRAERARARHADKRKRTR